jgi:hypothetical protein
MIDHVGSPEEPHKISAEPKTMLHQIKEWVTSKFMKLKLPQRR